MKEYRITMETSSLKLKSWEIFEITPIFTLVFSSDEVPHWLQGNRKKSMFVCKQSEPFSTRR